MLEVALDELLRRLKALRDELDGAIARNGNPTVDTEAALGDVERLVDQIQKEVEGVHAKRN